MRRTTSDFRLFVFDLDGTLIDSRRDLTDSVNRLLVEYGAPALSEEQVARMVGDGAATLVARALKAGGVSDISEALPRFLAIYREHLTDHTRPYDGMPEVLTALGARAKLAVLTNKPIASTRTILERLNLAGHFDSTRVIGGDGPFPRKPDPAGLRELLRATATDPARALLVGDSLIDWRTARAAGTAICMARYGFGFEGFPVETLAPDDFAIDDPCALLDL